MVRYKKAERLDCARDSRLLRAGELERTLQKAADEIIHSGRLLGEEGNKAVGETYPDLMGALNTYMGKVLEYANQLKE